jgi:hypothetical protein
MTVTPLPDPEPHREAESDGVATPRGDGLTETERFIHEMLARLDAADMKAEQLERALVHCRDIGAAVGILMAHHKVRKMRRSSSCAAPARTRTASSMTSPLMSSALGSCRPASRNRHGETGTRSGVRVPGCYLLHRGPRSSVTAPPRGGGLDGRTREATTPQGFGVVASHPVHRGRVAERYSSFRSFRTHGAPSPAMR